eukprot:746507-Pyramimonas_sp.AAC.1
MQALALAAIEGAGAVLFQGLRAALYERLIGQPPLAGYVDSSAGSAWSAQADLSGGMFCPPAAAGAACPTVCLGSA